MLYNSDSDANGDGNGNTDGRGNGGGDGDSHGTSQRWKHLAKKVGYVSVKASTDFKLSISQSFYKFRVVQRPKDSS